MELEDRVLIVPNLLHFAGIGNPIEFRHSLQDLQIDVLLSESLKQVGAFCTRPATSRS
jgi:tetraacyldisaccharide-1-P 4'-kinase